ncbi:MAG TPA: hypothetical protein VFP46_00785, partial [Candidatus Paceibacterota bacterium]|nr:hypothetical protein [Candidatus Paceibacterota bacterium]
PNQNVPGTMNGTIVVRPSGGVALSGTTTASGSSVLGASTSQPNIPTSDGSGTTIFNGVLTGQNVVQVGIFDNFFNPHSVIIAQGGTVTWTNRGAGTHNVIADDGSFASGAMGPNATYSHIFNVPGTYLYYDSASGGRGGTGMFGTIVVLSPTQVAQTRGTTGTVLGATTGVPNVPNTGAGGDAAASMAVLGATGLMLFAASFLFLRKRFAQV